MLVNVDPDDTGSAFSIRQQVHAALPGRHRRHCGQHGRWWIRCLLPLLTVETRICGPPDHARRTPWAIIGMTPLMLGHDVNTTDPAQIEAAKTKSAELVQNVKDFSHSDSPKTALIGGDAYWASPGW